MYKVWALFVIVIIELSLPKSTSAGQYFFSVCYDTTRSVPAKQFMHYPDIVRSSVLELVKPGDVVTLLRVDQPDADPETFVLENRLTRFEQGVRGIYSQLRELKQSRVDHGTDIGLILNHARQRIELDQTINRTKPPKYITVCVSDGVPEKKQTKGNWTSPARGDWVILFLGVREGTEEGIRRLANEAGFRDRDRIHIVPFSHWKEIAPSIPKLVGRPSNPSLAKVLSRVTGPDVERRK